MAQLSSQSFASLDPDLASIAARAAVEVDALIKMRGVGQTYLARLADVMTEAFGEEPALAGGACRFLDPIDTDVMFRTLREARPRELTSYDALRTASLELAQRLREPNAIASQPGLDDLRRFCVALSKHALVTSHRRDEPMGSRVNKR